MSRSSKFSKLKEVFTRRLPNSDSLETENDWDEELSYHPLEIKYRMAEKTGIFLFMGSSVKKGIDRLMQKNADEEVVAEIFIDLSRRLSKSYVLLFVTMLFCLGILLFQSKKNRKQESLLENQNLQLSKLVAKNEAEDETVFILESGNISEEISRELILQKNTNTRNLSAPLIGRIIAFSRMIGKDNAVNRALDGTRDEIATSLERGSLLVMLRSAELGGETYKRIYQEADFSYADLRGAKLWEADFRGINLSYANFNKADLQDANLEEADLQMANFQGAFLLNVKMEGASLQGANLDGANLWMIDLSNTNLINVSLKETEMKDAQLKGARAEKGQLSDFLHAKADTTGMVWVD